MESRYHSKFMLLDFDYPMNKATVNIVIKSLQNILPLGLSFPWNAGNFNFGISVLNSDFTLIQSFSYFKENYNLINRSLDALDKTVECKGRVTVQEYKQLLITSISTILHKFQAQCTNDSNLSNEKRIYMTMVTKKTASLISQILTNVTSELHKNNSNIPLMKKIEIVQISNERGGRNRGTVQNSNCHIDWVTCSDNVHDINCIFKNWLLNPGYEQEQLDIMLSIEMNLVVKCDVEDCVVNILYTPFYGKFFLNNDHSVKASNNPLGIIGRIPLSGLCPSLVFGIPRRVYATLSRTLSRTEIHQNYDIFRQLCRELFESGQGLLVKSSYEAEGKKIDSFHFISSDGHMLLMNDVVSDELYLPEYRKPLKLDPPHETASSLVKTCLEEIDLFEEYSPENFFSGYYEYLRNRLMQAGDKKSLFGHLDPNSKLFEKKGGRQSKSNKKNPKTPKRYLCQTGREKTQTQESSQQKEEHNLVSKAETKNTHPALLPPSVVKKYRTVYSSAFDLPELGDAYNESLM